LAVTSPFNRSQRVKNKIGGTPKSVTREAAGQEGGEDKEGRSKIDGHPAQPNFAGSYARIAATVE
jgi:hypothetical protein